MPDVAFLPGGAGSGWLGGVTYYRNLFYAVSLLRDESIRLVVFTGKYSDDTILEQFAPYAHIVKDGVFDLWKPKWIAARAVARLLGRDYFLDRLCRRHTIAALSHIHQATGGSLSCKTIGWIPDFQHLHLPEMFSEREIRLRSATVSDLAKECDAVILSSHDAEKDFRSFVPAYAHKARVLHFVSQTDSRVYDSDRSRTEERFSLDRKYFFLPNQFWKHKNHRVVFEAVKLLKDRGHDVLLVCSGFMEDYRNISHLQYLQEFSRMNTLEGNIRMLGVISRADLFCLMRNCISVLNPSLFEGWSTTVEEARSLGKNVILSDINVHREQSPPGSVFFEPSDAEGLAEVLLRKWQQSDGGPDHDLEDEARANLRERTLRFAQEYREIVLGCLS